MTSCFTSQKIELGDIIQIADIDCYSLIFLVTLSKAETVCSNSPVDPHPLELPQLG